MADTQKYISSEDYYAVVGLLTVAGGLVQQLNGITSSLAALTGDKDGDMCGDAVYCGYDATELLKRLNLEVRGQAKTAKRAKRDKI